MAFYSVDPVRFGVDVSGTTTTLGVNDPELGTKMVVDELEYLFVYNAGGEQIGVGQPVVLIHQRPFRWYRYRGLPPTRKLL